MTRRQLEAMMAWVEAVIDAKLNEDYSTEGKFRAKGVRAELFQSFGIADLDPPRNPAEVLK